MVDVPTVSDLRARYPEFASVSDPVAVGAIGEASLYVDDGWDEGMQSPAILALAAHYLSLEGYPRRSIAEGGGQWDASSRQMVSRRVGDVTVEYESASSASAGGSGDFTSSLKLTVYGRKFLQYLRVNAPTLTVV